MAVDGGKSVATASLDLLRHALVLAATAYATYGIWKWNWIAAVVTVIPVYVIVLNLLGFLTLPLYLFTPEIRRTRETEKALFQRKP